MAHMAEEVEDAGIVVPRSMVWSFILNIPFTFGMVISYLYCMPSVADAVSDPTGFPFIYVFRQATGTVGGTTGMTVVILFLIIMITISAMASTSRQTFAFARDNGLPFGFWLGKVSSNYKSVCLHFEHQQFLGTSKVAHSSKLYYCHRYLQFLHGFDQHWEYCRLQRYAFSFYSRSHGYLCCLYWLRHDQAHQETATTPSPLVSRPRWLANQLYGDVVCLLGVLLEFLA